MALNTKDIAFMEQSLICEHYHGKASFWLGAQFGSIIGLILLIGGPTCKYFIMLGIWCVLAIISHVYIKKHGKSVDKLGELV